MPDQLVKKFYGGPLIPGIRTRHPALRLVKTGKVRIDNPFQIRGY
jgi:hypothetical protein